MKIHQLTAGVLATMLMVGSALAQQPQPGSSPINQSQSKSRQQDQNRSTSGTLPQRTTGESSVSKEHAIAKCLVIMNQEQVALARFAKDKASGEEVKAFAATLEKAHQGSLEELKGLATKTSMTSTTVQTGTPSANSNSAGIDFVQIHQEMSDQCLKDSKEMLSKKEGAEFDKCFVGMQLAKHSMMHTSLTVLERHTTGALQGFIKKSLATNDEHLQASVDLMEALDNKAVTKTAKNTK